MKLVYKAIFLKKLQLLLSKDLLQTQGMDVEKQMRQASFKKWKVYAKSPFGSVASVVEYLGRYTHKVAVKKGRYNPKQRWVHGVFPATKNFVFATNYL